MAYKAPPELTPADLCTSILTTLRQLTPATLASFLYSYMPTHRLWIPFLSGGLFSQVVVAIRSQLKSHLYNKNFPDHLAKVASQALFLNNTSEPSFRVFYTCELFFPHSNGRLYDSRDQLLLSMCPWNLESAWQHNIYSINVMTEWMSLPTRAKCIHLRATNEFLLLRAKISFSLNVPL